MRPNSTALMNPENTPTRVFGSFFEGWLHRLNTNLEHLVSAANRHSHEQNVEEPALRLLINQSVDLYDEYYKEKSDAAKVDITAMFSHTWLTSIEDGFLWIAGWRPTTAIQLLYSKSGLQLENRLADLCPVFWTEDLGDLDLNQMNRINELQMRTIREERKLSEVMATHQESAADTLMVDLSNSVSEKMRKDDEEGAENGTDENDGRVESTLKPKKDELEKVLSMADHLRTKTLKSLIEILTPIQAVYFLIAAAELHLRLHEWGLKKDADAIT